MESSQEIRIAASILAADFANLSAAVSEAEAAGVDRIHVDVMDGHFVPNISIGTPVVASLRKITELPLETHLMIEEPIRYLEAFAQAGSDSLLVHVEGQVDLHRTVQTAKDLGVRVGVVINPATSADAVDAILDEVDQVLVMTVDPGFGGQALIPSTIAKVGEIRKKLDLAGSEIELSVDGGIGTATAGTAVAAGARVLVAGSAIFRGQKSIATEVEALKAAAAGGE